MASRLPISDTIERQTGQERDRRNEVEASVVVDVGSVAKCHQVEAVQEEKAEGPPTQPAQFRRSLPVFPNDPDSTEGKRPGKRRDEYKKPSTDRPRPFHHGEVQRSSGADPKPLPEGRSLT